MARRVEADLARRSFPFSRGLALGAVVAVVALALLPHSAGAGDSLYGRVTVVTRADLVTFDYGAGTYQIHLAGIILPPTRAARGEAVQFVANLLLDRNARLRFGGRSPRGEMFGKIFTDAPEIGILDVAVEMVRAGLVQRDVRYSGYRYGEMTTAEEEAQSAQRGIWRGANQ